MSEDTRNFLEKYHKESYLWALRCCEGNGENAGEALQESYLKILDGRAKFSGKSEFRTWLFSVIRLTAADLKRRHVLKKIRDFEVIELFKYLLATKASESQDLENKLSRAITELSPRQQQVLSLVFYHDFTIEKAAAIMNVSVGSARTHYERGKVNLKRKIKQHDIR